MLRDSFGEPDSVILGMTAFYSAVSMACLWAFGIWWTASGAVRCWDWQRSRWWSISVCWCRWVRGCCHSILQRLFGPIHGRHRSFTIQSRQHATRHGHSTADGTQPFFALYTVVTSLISGFSPLSWASCRRAGGLGRIVVAMAMEPVQSVVRRGGLHYDDRGCHANRLSERGR